MFKPGVITLNNNVTLNYNVLACVMLSFNRIGLIEIDLFLRWDCGKYVEILTLSLLIIKIDGMFKRIPTKSTPNHAT